MKIYELTQIDDTVVMAFTKLIPQLGDIPAPDKKELEEIIRSGHTKVFVAEENEIIGTLTLVFQKIPSGTKAWIEDVVVDASSRGKGTGKKLIMHALDFARKAGIGKIDLTSRSERTAANALYLKMGFIKRETNVYRYKNSHCCSRKDL